MNLKVHHNSVCKRDQVLIAQVHDDLSRFDADPVQNLVSRRRRLILIQAK
jgi:hypothetical protein